MRPSHTPWGMRRGTPSVAAPHSTDPSALTRISLFRGYLPRISSGSPPGCTRGASPPNGRVVEVVIEGEKTEILMPGPAHERLGCARLRSACWTPGTGHRCRTGARLPRDPHYRPVPPDPRRTAHHDVLHLRRSGLRCYQRDRRTARGVLWVLTKGSRGSQDGRVVERTLIHP
jgi:hypothetical protein